MANSRNNQNESENIENLYFYLYKKHPHPMWIYDTDTLKFIDVNDAAVNNYGYTKEEFLSINLRDIRPQEDIPLLLENVQTESEILQRSRTFRHKKKDGSIIHVEISSNKIPSPAGKNYRLVMAIDITEQYRAEKLLKENEERLRSRLDEMLEGCQILGFDWRYVYLNKTAEVYNRRPNKELLGNKYMDMWPGIEKTEVFKKIKSCMEERITYNMENEFAYPDGLTRWFELRIQPVSEGVFILSLDKTERKQAVKKLEEAHLLLKVAAEIAKLGGWYVNLEENRVYWSDEVAAIHEMPAGYNPLVEEAINFYAPEWHDKIIKVFTDCVQKGIPYNEEMEIITANGTRKWVQTTGEPVRDQSGKIVKVQGAFQDITVRKYAEIESIKNRQILQLFVENAPAAIAMFDTEMKYLAYSKRYLIDYRINENNIIGKSHYKVFPEMPDRWKEIHKRCLAGATEEYEEDFFPREDGSVDWLRWKILPWFNNNNEIGGVILFSELITKRKQAEEKARKSTAELEAALSSMTDAIIISDAEGRFIHFNDAFASFHKFKDKEECATTLHEYHNFLDVYFPDGNLAPHEKWAVSRALSGESASNVEYILQRTDTGDTWVGSYSFAPIRDKDGNITGSVVTARDITEEKKNNDALRDSITRIEKSERAKSVLLDRLNDAQKTAKIGSWDWDLDSGELWWSDELYNIFDLNPDKYTPSVQNMGEFFHPDDFEKFNKEIKRVIQTGGKINYDLRVITKKGFHKYCNSKGKVEIDEQGNPVRFSGTIMDITESKTSEMKLKKLMNRLIESEELYRKKTSQQLHDEVGQNLTALTINLNYISSQLSPQLHDKLSDRLKDSLSILDNTVDQIRNIMIELRPSVLDDYGLFSALKWTSNLFQERTGINVAFKSGDLAKRLPLNIEHALFRTVQEIFHNIAKHSDASNVYLDLHESNDSIKLTVLDDGIGFDVDSILQDPSKTSFGLQSITERMKLIDADFNISSEPGNGTSITIELKR